MLPIAAGNQSTSLVSVAKYSLKLHKKHMESDNFTRHYIWACPTPPDARQSILSEWCNSDVITPVGQCSKLLLAPYPVPSKKYFNFPTIGQVIHLELARPKEMFQTLHSLFSYLYLLTTLLTTLAPRPLSDFILQLFLHSCEIKSGSGLRTRQPPDPITVAIPLITLAQTSPKRTSLSLSQMIVSLIPRPRPAFHHLQYDFIICARGEPGNKAKW